MGAWVGLSVTGYFKICVAVDNLQEFSLVNKQGRNAALFVFLAAVLFLFPKFGFLNKKVLSPCLSTYIGCGKWSRNFLTGGMAVQTDLPHNQQSFQQDQSVLYHLHHLLVAIMFRQACEFRHCYCKDQVFWLP